LFHKLRFSLKTLGDYATSSAGIVSAANDFFILRANEIVEKRLESWARPILKKGAFLPSDPIFSEDELSEISRREPAFLLDFVRDGAPPLSEEALNYISEGEKAGLDQRPSFAVV